MIDNATPEPPAGRLPTGLVEVLTPDGADRSRVPFPDLVQLLAAGDTADPLDVAEATVAHCQELAATLTAKFQDAILACHNLCTDATDGCRGCLTAEMERVLAKYRPALVKCQNKIGKAASDRFALAMDSLGRLGLAMPPPAMVQAVLQGADPRFVIERGLPDQPVSPCGPNEIEVTDELGQVHCVPAVPPPVLPPDVPAGPGPCDDPGTCVICPPGQHYDPARGFCVPDEQVTCPPGTHFEVTNRLTGEGHCVPDTPPPPDVPPVVPPTGPGGPGGGPGGGPQPGGPIVVDGKCCWPKVPSTLISCTVQKLARHVKYWIRLDLGECDRPRVCVYMGDDPPEAGPNSPVYGPYDFAPSAADVAAIILPACGPVGPVGGGPGGGGITPIETRPCYKLDVSNITVPDGYIAITANDGNSDQQQLFALRLPIPAGWKLTGVAGPTWPLAPWLTCDNPVNQTQTPVARINDQCQIYLLPTDSGYGECYRAPPPGSPIPPPPGPSSLTSCDLDSLVSNWRRQQNSPVGTGVLTGVNTTVADAGFFSTLFGSISPTAIVKGIVEGVIAASTQGAIDQLEHSPCNSGSFLYSAINGVLVHIFGGWFGAVPEAVQETNRQLQNLACQFRFPSGGELHAVRSRDLITEEQWQAGLAVNGLCIPWQKPILEASYRYPGITDATAARRRNLIDSETWYSFLKRDGVKDLDTANLFYTLTEYVPGPNSLIRYMLRDVEDTTAVEAGQLDAEFSDKFVGKIKQWADAQGIPESVMRDEWRAHWQWPSETQLYQMQQRLREDSVVPGTDIPVKAVTADEILKVLGYNDISPAWRARLAKIAYRVPQRRDIGKMYEVGAVDESELSGLFQDAGYSPETADTFAEYVKRDSGERKAKQLGYPPRTVIVRLYKADALTRDNAQQFLELNGLPADSAKNALLVADEERDATRRAKQIAALRRRFLQGDYDVQQATRKLTDWGVADNRIQPLIDVWRDELDLKRKEPTVASLCEWAGRGYITTETYMRRLLNLGYTYDDANNFMQSCAAKYQEKVIRETEAAGRKLKRQLKEDSLCRAAPKPFCSPKTVRTHQDKLASTNGKPPTRTTTDTDTTTSG